MNFTLPPPDGQAAFAASLSELRGQCLQDALFATVGGLSIHELDAELSVFVTPWALSRLATKGLRGEMMFPVPKVLRANPRLLGYYRLLLGYSRKEFYTTATGLGRFSSMEDRGIIRPAVSDEIDALARALCEAAAHLLSELGTLALDVRLLDDLTLLTLGPQLRGAANVRKGAVGTQKVFDAIRQIVGESATSVEATKIVVLSATGRTVLIQFAPDPDIVILEEMRPDVFRKIVAIEVKAGSDFSNIHNRIGEAEKSHQKAKGDGFAECWTVVNVDNIDLKIARQESPTTNRFYRISDLVAGHGADYADFRDRVISLTGIPTP